MTTSQSDNDPQQLWKQLIEAHFAYLNIRKSLFVSGADIVALVKSGLRKPGERYEALTVAGILDESKRREVFSDLVWTASWDNGYHNLALQVIDSIDREWVRKHLLAETLRVLDQADAERSGNEHDEYGCMMSLLERYQSPFLERVMERAAAHPNSDVREAAHDFRERLRERH